MKILIEAEVPEGVRFDAAKEYVTVALACWGKGYHPDEDLFDGG